VDVTDGELMEYISESSMMSKALAEYEGAPWARHQHSVRSPWHMHVCFPHALRVTLTLSTGSQRPG